MKTLLAVLLLSLVGCSQQSNEVDRAIENCKIDGVISFTSGSEILISKVKCNNGAVFTLNITYREAS